MTISRLRILTKMFGIGHARVCVLGQTVKTAVIQRLIVNQDISGTDRIVKHVAVT